MCFVSLHHVQSTSQCPISHSFSKTFKGLHLQAHLLLKPNAINTVCMYFQSMPDLAVWQRHSGEMTWTVVVYTWHYMTITRVHGWQMQSWAKYISLLCIFSNLKLTLLSTYMVLTSSWTAHVWPVVIEDSLQHWVQHIQIPARALKQVQLIMMYGMLKSTYPWDSAVSICHCT